MVLVNPSNDAVVAGIQETNRRLNRKHRHAIVVLPDDDRFKLILVDASTGEGRTLNQLKHVNRVAGRNVSTKIRHLSNALKGLSEDEAEGEVPVFLNDEHEGQYRRCWRSVDTHLNPVNIGSRPIVEAYNPTVC